VRTQPCGDEGRPGRRVTTGSAPRASRTRAAIVLVATLAAIVLFVRLGVWQLHRAGEKTALEAVLDARAALPPVAQRDLATTPETASLQHYRRVVLRGRWLTDRTVWLDNRQMGGRPGFFVVTPLAWADGAVLVQRGWVPRDNDVRTRLPPLPTPAGEVEIVGRIAPPPARLYEFAGGEGGAIRQNLDVAAYAREIGVALLPMSVLQDDPPGAAGATPADGLSRHWPRPAVDVHKHHGYAFQWFAFAALAAGLYVRFQLLPRRRRRTDRPVRRRDD